MEKFVAERIKNTPPSGIRKFFDIAATMKDVISMGIGEPDFTTPEPIIAAGIASLRRGDTHYTSNSGTLQLREAVSRQLERLYNVKYSAENEILVTVGVSEAIYLIMNAIINPGDEVIIPEPTFVSYGPEVLFSGGVVVPVATQVANEFMVTASEIERVITPKTKAIMICYPNNPTGAVLSRELLVEIVELAVKYDLLLISDEIYDRLIYGVEHTCVPSIAGARERTVLLGGFSKNYAMTGWRVGYACGHPEIIEAMKRAHQYTVMSAPSIAQAAAVAAIEEGEEHVEEMRQAYDRRRRLVVDGFNTIGLDCFEPRGAFYAFPSIERLGMTGDEFAMGLLEQAEVAVVPGEAFGAAGTGFIRAAYAQSYSKLEEALNRIEGFVRKHS